MSGTFDDEVRVYDGFDAPTMFRYGIAFEPIENASQRLTLALEANQPADNAQAVKAGLEWMWLGRLALRSGYNFNADALKFSAGAGVNAPPSSYTVGGRQYIVVAAGGNTQIDYKRGNTLIAFTLAD